MPGLSEFSAGYGLDEYTTKSGRRKAQAEEQQLDIGALQLQIAKSLYGGTGPLRDSVTSSMGDFTGSGILPGSVQPAQPNLAGLDTFLANGQLPAALQPGALPAVPTGPSVPNLAAGQRDLLEQQFQVARDRTIDQAPAIGGSLGQSLGQLEGQRALGVTQLYDKQLDLQYQQDSQRQLAQHQQDLAEAQRQNTMKSTLYGVGLDINRDQATQENQLRRALYASAVGTAYGQPSSALSGLAGANSSFGSVASLALNESLAKQKAAQDKAGTLGGMAAGGKGGGKQQSGGQPGAWSSTWGMN